MKWSWKRFFLTLVATFAASVALSFGIGQLIDPAKVPAGRDLTLFSMILGSLAACALLAALSGWNHWNRKILWTIVVITSVFSSGNPGTVILSVLISAVVCFMASKLRLIFGYYLPARDVSEKTESVHDQR